METLDRPALPLEIENMRSSLRDSLNAGAVGISTRLAYAPNQSATTDEVAALASEIQDFGGV